MKQKNIKTNAILNAIKSGLSVLFPLITFPYASRILGVANIGKINYSSSIVSYFSLIAALGISTYAVRQGSKKRDDQVQLSTFANEVFTLNVFSAMFSFVLLLGLVCLLPQLRSYRTIVLVQSISIVLSPLSVDWINTIYEDFAYITIRSIFTQIIFLLALFIFVKNADDYYIYAGLLVFSNCITYLLNYIHCRKYIRFKVDFFSAWKSHIKPSLVFFASRLAIEIYVSSDTTMIGWFNGDIYVGLYAVSVKIYTVVRNILTSIYMVTIPRLSNYVAKSDWYKFKELLTDISSILILLILPAGAGLIALSKEMVVLISGGEYAAASISLSILGVALIFAVPSGIMVNCINTPLGKEAVSLKATIISAIVNICLNFLFVPLFKQNGAAVTTVVSELVVLLYCVKKIKSISDYIDFSKLKRNTVQGLVGAGEILIVAVVVKMMKLTNILAILLTAGVGGMIYLLYLMLVKNEYIVTLISELKKRIY